jgi:hypothetical protein
VDLKKRGVFQADHREMIAADPLGTRTTQWSDPEHIVASFLVGTSLKALTKSSKLPFGGIYEILQDHYVTLIPKLEQTIKFKDNEIAWAKGRLNDAEAEISQLRAAIEGKDQEISEWMGTVGEREPH